MTTRIGDLIYDPNLFKKPAVVKEKEDNRLKLDYDREVIDEYHRNGLLNGLTEEQKETLNGILDEVNSEDAGTDRIEALEKQLQEVKANGGDKRIVGYLEHQLTFLSRKYNIVPSVILIDRHE